MKKLLKTTCFLTSLIMCFSFVGCDSDNSLGTIETFPSQTSIEESTEKPTEIPTTTPTEKPTEPPTEEKTDPPIETEADKPTENQNENNDITLGMTNALSSAKSYLDIMAFSHKGLIEQLEFDGYTNEEATYGVENCGADWNEQAAKSAQNYLDIMAFSRIELKEQLIFDGFTEEQAEYGVTAAGYWEHLLPYLKSLRLAETIAV